MPSVKVSVFPFGYQTKVFESVIKCIMIDMMYFHKRRCLCNKSVHPDCVSFSVDNFPGNDVFCRCGFQKEPFELR